MAYRVIMPALGIAQETGLITEWLKNEGDMVTEGEPLLEIETDKTTAVLDAEASGILTHITAFAGDDVPIAETIAWILAPGESLPGEADDEPVKAETKPAIPAPEAASKPKPTTANLPLTVTPLAGRIAQEHDLDLALVKPAGGKVTKKDVLAYLNVPDGAGQVVEEIISQSDKARLLPASPKARRLAAEKGYELKLISGSGPDGAVITADILAYRPTIPAPVTTPEIATLQAPAGASRAWKIMAQRLAESWRDVPHFYLTRDVDAALFLDWHKVAQKVSAETVTYTDLLVKISAVALQHHPRVNASWIDGDIQYNEAINIGLAVAVEDGLLVPVFHDADKLSLSEITVARKDIVSRTHAGKLKLQELQGGTFTISNLGMYRIDAFSAIVNPPQAAILAVGRIAERVVPVNGKAKIRPMMTLTLSLDHRVVDGARGAKFLDTLANFIEEPLSIL